MQEQFFDLSGHRSAKAAPALVAADEAHFREVAASLERSAREATEQLDAARLVVAGPGQRALDRDLEVRRLTARLRVLRRFDLDVCLGRFIRTGEREPVYIGRIGVADQAGRRLLVDWRTPAAEPFFAATLARPMGLSSRRRYRWTRGRVTDYWDEVLDLDDVPGDVTLDADSAFIASLGSSRSARMRDVLGTIQADQDAIIRAGSRGALVVDGGPGTGKTVVALHRAAYLLYEDPQLHRGGGILFVGPHEQYLAYVADVLPGLGEDSVRTCTLRQLVLEGAAAGTEPDPEAARLKASADLLAAVERAVDGYETPPSVSLRIETPWLEVELGAAEWAEAFAAADPAVPHNEARDEVWGALLDILIDRSEEDEAPAHLLRRYLAQDEDLTSTFRRAWPLLDPAGVVADLWAVPDFLRRCAPWLAPDEVRRLQRPTPRAWTDSDLPFLDAARRRIGDPEAPLRRRRREAALAAERDDRNRVVEELVAADDSEMQVMSILRGQDARNSLVDEAALPGVDPDVLAGPFAHIVVDEAQELTDAEWRMLTSRCPSRGFTVVGDRAQARRGFPSRGRSGWSASASEPPAGPR